MEEWRLESSPQVKARAGYTYPEEPYAFTWEGLERRVARVEREWREPGRKVYVVRDTANRQFLLAYSESDSSWQVSQFS